MGSYSDLPTRESAVRHVRARDAIRESAEALSRVRVSMCLIPASSPSSSSSSSSRLPCLVWQAMLRDANAALKKEVKAKNDANDITAQTKQRRMIMLLLIAVPVMMMMRRRRRRKRRRKEVRRSLGVDFV